MTWVRGRSLFMTGGRAEEMTFYENIFQGPLGLQTKHFAAYSTLCDNFSMLTLILTPTLSLSIFFRCPLSHCKHFWLIKVNRMLITHHSVDQCCSILIQWYIWRACNKRMLIDRCTSIKPCWSIDADWGSSMDQRKLIKVKLKVHQCGSTLINVDRC